MSGAPSHLDPDAGHNNSLSNPAEELAPAAASTASEEPSDPVAPPPLSEPTPGPVSNRIYQLVPVLRAVKAVLSILGEIGREQPWAARALRNFFRFVGLFLLGNSVFDTIQNSSAPTLPEQLLPIAGDLPTWLLILLLADCIWAGFKRIETQRHHHARGR